MELALHLTRIFSDGRAHKNPEAQGCEERATLGMQWRGGFNPERVVATAFLFRTKQGGGTTLSGLPPSLRPFPRVARSSQPWAGGHNPFGIEDACKVQELAPAFAGKLRRGKPAVERRG